MALQYQMSHYALGDRKLFDDVRISNSTKGNTYGFNRR